MLKNIFSLSFLLAFTFLFSACFANRSSVSNTSQNVQSGAAKDSNSSQTTDETKSGTTVGKIGRMVNGNENDDEDTSGDKTENSSKSKIENRCGWYENPTPGNHWLTDKDGEWIIGMQGDFQADGDYPPEFSDEQWVKTNVNYGYGCACLRVETDRKEMRILKVVSATARPLSVCRNDKALKEPAE